MAPVNKMNYQKKMGIFPGAAAKEKQQEEEKREGERERREVHVMDRTKRIEREYRGGRETRTWSATR